MSNEETSGRRRKRSRKHKSAHQETPRTSCAWESCCSGLRAMTVEGSSTRWSNFNTRSNSVALPWRNQTAVTCSRSLERSNGSHPNAPQRHANESGGRKESAEKRRIRNRGLRRVPVLLRDFT